MKRRVRSAPVGYCKQQISPSNKNTHPPADQPLFVYWGGAMVGYERCTVYYEGYTVYYESCSVLRALCCVLRAVLCTDTVSATTPGLRSATNPAGRRSGLKIRRKKMGGGDGIKSIRREWGDRNTTPGLFSPIKGNPITVVFRGFVRRVYASGRPKTSRGGGDTRGRERRKNARARPRSSQNDLPGSRRRCQLGRPGGAARAYRPAPPQRSCRPEGNADEKRARARIDSRPTTCRAGCAAHVGGLHERRRCCLGGRRS